MHASGTDLGNSRTRIVVLDGATLNPGDLSWAGLEAMGDLRVYERTEEKLVLERIRDAEVVYTNKTVISRDHIAQSRKLKLIGVLATGYNVVDVIAARDAGVAVCNIPAYGTMSVAQFATALMLELCHRVGRHSEDVRSGSWAKSEDFCYWLSPLTELDGKTLGLIGFGRIGQAFARMAVALGMKVIFHDKVVSLPDTGSAMEQVSIERLYRESDVISLHCPLLDGNHGMINKDAISLMKPGVWLINTARGPLIVEQDLADALRTGRVGGAALDVLSTEPPSAGNPLLSAPNCIVTPHIAWSTREARGRLMQVAVENLVNFKKGTPTNLVN